MGMHASINLSIGYRSIDHLVTEVLYLPWPNASNMGINDLALEVDWIHARRVVELHESEIRAIPFEYQYVYWALRMAITTAQQETWKEHDAEHEACYQQSGLAFVGALNCFYNKYFKLVFV